MTRIEVRDYELVKELVLYPLTMTAIDTEKKRIRKSDVRFPNLICNVFDKAMDRYTKAHGTIRAESKKRGIKLGNIESTDIEIKAPFLCRGYHDEFIMLWDHAKAEIEIRIQLYIEGNGGGTRE